MTSSSLKWSQQQRRVWLYKDGVCLWALMLLTWLSLNSMAAISSGHPREDVTMMSSRLTSLVKIPKDPKNLDGDGLTGRLDPTWKAQLDLIDPTSTSTHRPGSHWVAIYVDGGDGYVEYFDSKGRAPRTSYKAPELVASCRLSSVVFADITAFTFVCLEVTV